MMAWLMVACGGALGACARFAIGMWLQPQPGRFPVATFTANVVGCFLMGMLYVMIIERQWLPPSWRPPLMVGFLGALTTFSSFSIEALALWHTHHNLLAATYVIGSMVVCLVAVWLGYNLTAWSFNAT